jgi:hypothetical protein
MWFATEGVCVRGLRRDVERPPLQTPSRPPGPSVVLIVVANSKNGEKLLSRGASGRCRRRSRQGRYRWNADMRGMSARPCWPSSSGRVDRRERDDRARPWGTARWSPCTPAGDVPAWRAAQRPARSAEQLPEHLSLPVRLIRLARPALRLRQAVVGTRVRGQLPHDRGALIQRAHRRP